MKAAIIDWLLVLGLFAAQAALVLGVVPIGRSANLDQNINAASIS